MMIRTPGNDLFVFVVAGVFSLAFLASTVEGDWTGLTEVCKLKGAYVNIEDPPNAYMTSSSESRLSFPNGHVYILKSDDQSQAAQEQSKRLMDLAKEAFTLHYPVTLCTWNDGTYESCNTPANLLCRIAMIELHQSANDAQAVNRRAAIDTTKAAVQQQTVLKKKLVSMKRNCHQAGTNFQCLQQRAIHSGEPHSTN